MIVELQQENPDGECLELIDNGDIKSWGITDFRHKKAILKHIKSLINNNNSKQNDDVNLQNQNNLSQSQTNSTRRLRAKNGPWTM